MEWLNYHHLRYFWTVAKEGSLARAAEKLHVSQPSISEQIRELESAFGEKLFRREGRNNELTDAGQIVLRLRRGNLRARARTDERRQAAPRREDAAALRRRGGFVPQAGDERDPQARLRHAADRARHLPRRARWRTCSRNSPRTGSTSSSPTNPRPAAPTSRSSTIRSAKPAPRSAPRQSWPRS